MSDDPAPPGPNPEGLDDWDPTEDPAYAAYLQAYSDKLRAAHGRPRIKLRDDPAARRSDENLAAIYADLMNVEDEQPR